jgi:tRNA pseudouridine55 synthase
VSRRKPRGRPVTGILLLDKPVGLTSNAALQAVKRIYQARKAGHTGNLDPMATGMLPICLGEATKVTGFLLEADKRYQAVFRLGVGTDTGDAEGEVVETRPVSVSRPEVEQALARFTGPIEQVPPMYSAIKHRGQPLYALARKGQEVERQPRRVSIYELRLLDLRGDDLEVFVHCSKGTYVRTLAEDIGSVLGVGAHVSELRRLSVGPFDDPEAMVSKERLEEAADRGLDALDDLLLPLDAALGHLPAVSISADMAFYFRQGQPLIVSRAPSSGQVRVYLNQQQFIGVGEIADDGRVAPKRLLGGG